MADRRKKRQAPAAATNTVGGYAERLSEYPNKGVTGLPESEDNPRRLERKLARLAELFQNANSVVFLTGAARREIRVLMARGDFWCSVLDARL